jgi:hypothetical protein
MNSFEKASITARSHGKCQLNEQLRRDSVDPGFDRRHIAQADGIVLRHVPLAGITVSGTSLQTIVQFGVVGITRHDIAVGNELSLGFFVITVAAVAFLTKDDARGLKFWRGIVVGSESGITRVRVLRLQATAQETKQN